MTATSSTAAALKYVDFRNRYALVRVTSSVPLVDGPTVARGCSICLGNRYALFAAEYRVRQQALVGDEGSARGSIVSLPSCAKCLKYIWHKNMVQYVNEKRRDAYRRRFADLVEFTTVLFPGECALLPTLRAFVELVEAGKPFRPGLIHHVSELVFQLRQDGGVRLRFLARCGAISDRDGPSDASRAMAHLRFRIDACTPPLTIQEQHALESFAGGSEQPP